jgi:hypothetical protein
MNAAHYGRDGRIFQDDVIAPAVGWLQSTDARFNAIGRFIATVAGYEGHSMRCRNDAWPSRRGAI